MTFLEFFAEYPILAVLGGLALVTCVGSLFAGLGRGRP